MTAMTATAIHDESTRPGPRPLRLVVMGTGPFAVPMFKALVASSHSIAAVITRPDRAAPGRRPPPNPMREAASAANLPILDPDTVNAPETVAVIRGLAPDLLVVCDYGQILSAELLAAAPLGGINLHGSLLPRHRGAAPVQWAILAGDPQTGVSVIHMTPALDAGAVIAVRSTPIGPSETASDLEARLAETGADAVLEAIERLQAARATGDHSAGTPQDESRATRAPRLTKSDGIVDWSRPAAAIERMRRALEPWPRTTTFLRRDGAARRLVLEEVSVAAARVPEGTAPGTVLAADDQGIVVACGEGTAVVITRLVPEGKRSMGVGEFLRGNAIHAGTQLG
ncbi:MAG: methionyl-tRNA formyltransferase [Planctomycetia bacterium]